MTSPKKMELEGPASAGTVCSKGAKAATKLLARGLGGRISSGVEAFNSPTGWPRTLSTGFEASSALSTAWSIKA